MEPNPAVGSDVGRAYISQEGFGRAAIYGPSQAADTYVTMRREKLAYERQQQAAQAKAAAEARSKAMEKLMEVPEYYEKFSDEVLDMWEETAQMGTELLDRGLDIDSASKDPVVREFQRKRQEMFLAAQTSITIKERDAEIAKIFAKEGAADEYDIEGYQQTNDEFFKDSLLNISKRVDKMPTPQSRYGAIETIKEIDLLAKSMDDGQPMTEEKAYQLAAAYDGDPTKQNRVEALVKTSNPEALMNQSVASGSKSIRIEAIKNAIMDSAKKPPTLLEFLDKQAEAVKADTGTFGTNEKDLDQKLRDRAKDIAAHNQYVYTYKDVDGAPPVIGNNKAELQKNMEDFIYKELKERAKIEKRDPGYTTRLAHSLKGKDDMPPAKMEDFLAKVKSGDAKAKGMLAGKDLPDGSKIESVDYSTFDNTITSGGSFRVITVTKDEDKEPVRSTRFLNEDEAKKLLFQPWMTTTQKKQVEATTTPETWQEVINTGAELD